MKILITGGTGFIGSHTAEYYLKRGDEVTVYDNVSRAKLLNCNPSNVMYNWNFLKDNFDLTMVRGDIRNANELEKAISGADVVIHTAAQTAVTASVIDPRTDFEINALGTFNVLEAARKTGAAVIYCSTNKVYGDNVNSISVEEKESRYEISDKNFTQGVSETFPTDLCEHTPYGASKFAGDIYLQDYARRNEIDAAVFRMSCIYGPRQFGVRDQGWVAWFTIATLLGKPITIYGDGKQVRDMLYVTDLVAAFDAFVQKREKLHHGVYNMGGGAGNTMSVRELLEYLGEFTGKRSDVSYEDWRPGDQKVYISDISKAKKELGWNPGIDSKEGVKRLAEWVNETRNSFQ